MTYISVTLCADLRAGSAAVWHGAGAVQPEGDMTPADFAPFNIIRIMRSTIARVAPAQRSVQGPRGCRTVREMHDLDPPPPARPPATPNH
jgi:hypothetical protein